MSSARKHVLSCKYPVEIYAVPTNPNRFAALLRCGENTPVINAYMGIFALRLRHG
ncbi:MAG: hypothetical protein LBS42_01030 [Tannerella sp.]|nr:hypothetical protein [Tannerella sp.]